jgi:hypothetical protein
VVNWKRGSALAHMKDSEFIIEEVADPTEIAQHCARYERAKRNSDWLQAHWANILPRARGKFVAVAGYEAFVASTSKEAWAQARKAHPEDDGALCQFLFPHMGPRFYGHRRRMADL